MAKAATAAATASRPATALRAAADSAESEPAATAPAVAAAVGAGGVAVADVSGVAEAATTAAPVGRVPLARPVATSWLPEATMVELKPLAVMTYVPPDEKVVPSSVKAVGTENSDEMFSVGVAI